MTTVALSTLSFRMVLAAIASCATLATSVVAADLDAAAPHEEAAPPEELLITGIETVPTAGNPFDALITPAGDVLVSVTANPLAGTKAGIEVFAPTAHGLVSRCLNPLAASLRAAPAGLTALPDESAVAAALGYPGIGFYSLSDLETCAGAPLIVAQGSKPGDSVGTFASAYTSTGDYAFVDNEYGVVPGSSLSGSVSVLRLTRDRNGLVTAADPLSVLQTGGDAITDVELSLDGRRLYVISEVKATGIFAAGADNPILGHGDCVQQVGSAPQTYGLLSVFDVDAILGEREGSALLATVAAGCSPVRVVETRDQRTLWVTARGDNRLLAFDTHALEETPANALVSYLDSGGAAPVGLELFDHDRYLAVANSNRFGGGTANAVIVNVADRSAPKLESTIATGLFPRQIRVGHDDSTLYLTNYNSLTLQVIATTRHRRRD